MSVTPAAAVVTMLGDVQVRPSPLSLANHRIAPKSSEDVATTSSAPSPSISPTATPASRVRPTTIEWRTQPPWLFSSQSSSPVLMPWDSASTRSVRPSPLMSAGTIAATSSVTGIVSGAPNGIASAAAGETQHASAPVINAACAARVMLSWRLPSMNDSVDCVVAATAACAWLYGDGQAIPSFRSSPARRPGTGDPGQALETGCH